jgi:hypothetical protein
VRVLRRFPGLFCCTSCKLKLLKSFSLDLPSTRLRGPYDELCGAVLEQLITGLTVAMATEEGSITIDGRALYTKTWKVRRYSFPFCLSYSRIVPF